MNKVFVTGQMRSGTTFLCNFLNSQENCSVYADFLRTLFIDGEKLKISKIDITLSEAQKNVLISSMVAEARMFNIHAFDSLKKEQFSTWNELFTICLDILQKYDGNTSASLVGVKKTIEIYYISELLEHNVKIIYIYRDPRDVLLSAKNRMADYNLFRFLGDWKRNMDFIFQFERNKNLLLIKYEDLISQKENASKTISNFLEVDVNPNIESLTLRKNTHYTDNSSFQDISKLFDTSALFRWKNYMESDEVVLTSIVLEDYINRLGYDSYTPAKRNYKQILSKFKKYNLKLRAKSLIKNVLDKI